MERLVSCPLLTECSKRRIFKDTDGALWDWDSGTKNLVPHKHSLIVGKNDLSKTKEMPTIFYLVKWRNKRTGHDRWMPPVRSRVSCFTAPKDTTARRNGTTSKSIQEWDLIEIRRFDLSDVKYTTVPKEEWEPIR